MTATRIGVLGARGRMGSVVCRAARDAEGVELVAEVGSDDPLSLLIDRDVRVAVDFTRPDTVLANIRWCVERGIHVVVGTDVLPESNFDVIRGWLAQRPGVGVLIAPGFSTSVVLGLHLARLASRHFDEAEVVERHHAGKRDAPASPAVHMARAVARAVRAAGRPPGAPHEGGVDIDGVPVHALRVPGVFSQVEVVLTRAGETLTIAVEELDRSCIPPVVFRAVRTVPRVPGLTVGVAALLGL